MLKTMNRRDFTKLGLASAAALALGTTETTAAKDEFRLNYIVASCMYGKFDLATILNEVPKTGAEYVEFWASPHGNQREQLDKLGVDKVVSLLKNHKVKLGSFTCFKYGVFGMQPEMKLVKQLGGDMVICNSGGPRGLKGDDQKRAIEAFAKKLKPHVEAAADIGVKVGIENHSGSLINMPDTQFRLLDALKSDNVGIALAPYHLPQDEKLIAKLLRDLGSEKLVHFQAWQHGMGCSKKLPKEQELLQLPGRGDLDFTPLVKALKDIKYVGRTEIFMHPVPRGIPILETADMVTAEINKSRKYLEDCLKKA